MDLESRYYLQPIENGEFKFYIVCFTKTPPFRNLLTIALNQVAIEQQCVLALLVLLLPKHTLKYDVRGHYYFFPHKK